MFSQIFENFDYVIKIYDVICKQNYNFAYRAQAKIRKIRMLLSSD